MRLVPSYVYHPHSLHSALLCVHTCSIHMFAISLTYRQTTCTYFPSLISVVYPALLPLHAGCATIFAIHSFAPAIPSGTSSGVRQWFARPVSHPRVSSCSYRDVQQ